MTKQIYIHVGAGKTGTSAIQEFISRNQDKLENAGWTIPTPGMVRSGNSLYHHRLSDWGNYKVDDVMSLWGEIASLNDEKLLLSSEVFHSKISGAGGQAFFRTIADLFAGREIKIIFYIRRQSQWLQSAYQQWVKANNLAQDFEEFAQGYKNSLADQIFLFAKVFGKENVIVRPYEKGQFRGGDIFTDFFKVLGIAIDQSWEYPERNPNPRLSAHALEFKRQVNSFCETAHESNIVLGQLSDYSARTSQHYTSEIHRTHSLMSGEVEAEIELREKPKYEVIARDFLGRSDGVLFLDGLQPKEQSPAPDAGASVEAELAEVHQLYAFFFHDLYKKTRRLSRLNKQLAERVKALEERD